MKRIKDDCENVLNSNVQFHLILYLFISKQWHYIITYFFASTERAQFNTSAVLNSSPRIVWHFVCLSYCFRRLFNSILSALRSVRVLSLRSSVIHGFVTEPWFSHHVLFSCERAASSVLEPCSLSSAYLVSCWSVVFGSRHSCLEFRFLVGVRTLALRFLSLCECAVLRSLGCTLSCPRVFCCVARSSCFYRLRAFMLNLVLCGTQLVYSLAACFHVVMSCVNMWLMSFLISCVFMSCFAHGWRFVCWPCACVFVLCEHVASVLVFCVPCALMSICLDPTHLVTCLINFPQLLSLVTLLICSL